MRRPELLLAGLLAFAAQAQTFPAKPVRVIVPFPAGGTVDTTGRVVAQKLSEAWKQPVLVDNRPGAGGNIGAEAVAKATPDGHVLLLSIQALAISANLYRKLPFDPVKELVPVSQLTSSIQALVVHSKVPFQSVKELVAFAKANPGKLNFGTSGPGAPNHLFGELLKTAAGIDIVAVPYKGDAPQAAALLAGEVEMAFMPALPVLPHLKSGKLRALAAVTSGRRSDFLPDVPTMGEAGVPDFNFGGWIGLFAPAGTPPDIVQRIASDAARVVVLPDVQEKIRAGGSEPVSGTAEQFAARYQSDVARLGRIIREAKVPLID